MESMDEHEGLAEQFEANRTHLQAVAYQMLGSLSEADDAVQESWLRLSRSDTSGIENLGGWLTTVVARICLDMLRSRNSRREESLEAAVSESIESREEGIDPEQEALLADSVGLALLVHLFLVLNFTIRNDKIVEIEAVGDPARLRQLHVAVLDD